MAAPRHDPQPSFSPIVFRLHSGYSQGTMTQISQLSPSLSLLHSWTWVELRYRRRGLSAETGGAMLRVDTTHSYITEPEIIRSGNSDPLCAFINSYLSLKNLVWPDSDFISCSAWPRCACSSNIRLKGNFHLKKKEKKKLEKVTVAVHRWPYETILSLLSG